MAPRFHLVLGCDTHGNVVLGGKAWAERGDEDDDEKCVLWFDTLVDEGTDSYADQKRRWWFAHIRDASATH